MIYIVSGLPRCGTSMMMHILKTIGIPPYYSEKREEMLLKNGNPMRNPYYYETPQVMQGRIEDLSILENQCVKIFANGLIQNPAFNKDNCKVIFMYRYPRIDGLRIPNREENEDSDRKENQRQIARHGMFNRRSIRIADLLVQCIYRYNTLVVEYDKVIENTVEEINRIQKHIDIDFNVEEVAKVVEPERRHVVRPPEFGALLADRYKAAMEKKKKEG